MLSLLCFIIIIIRRGCEESGISFELVHKVTDGSIMKRLKSFDMIIMRKPVIIERRIQEIILGARVKYSEDWI